MGHRARNGAGERAGEWRGAEKQRGKAERRPDQECVLPLALQHPDSWKAGPDALLLPLRVRQPPLAGPGGSLAFPIRSPPSSQTMRSPPTTAPLLTEAPSHSTAPESSQPSLGSHPSGRAMGLPEELLLQIWGREIRIHLPRDMPSSFTSARTCTHAHTGSQTLLLPHVPWRSPPPPAFSPLHSPQGPTMVDAGF